MGHSRSSSEICEVPLNEILPIFIEDFNLDFDFDDVKLNIQSIFTKHEYESIEQEKDSKKVLRLIWYLITKSDEQIKIFLNAIKDDYSWLVEKIYNAHNEKKNYINYIDFVKSLRSNFQRFTDYNVHRMEPYWDLKEALIKLKPNDFVILIGILGSGKKWLVKDVCCDYSVYQAMGSKIYFIDVQNCTSPEDDLEKLRNLRIQVKGDLPSSGTISPTHTSFNDQKQNIFDKECLDSISNRILDVQQSLKKILKQPDYRNCLIVLENVQNKKSWKAFNLGCKILIITKKAPVANSISEKLSKRLEIKPELTIAEFYETFEKYTGKNRETFPRDDASDIYRYSKGHPNILGIIAQNIKRDPKSWHDWKNSLLQSEVTNEKLFNVIANSIKRLQKYLGYYAYFGIFSHSIPIPLELLAFLWDKTSIQAEEIARKFHEHSLVSYNYDEKTCTIHLIFRSQFEKITDIQEEIKDPAALHKKVVDFYKIDEAFQQRNGQNLFNSQQPYLFLCIEYHLQNAGRTELFSKLFLDFGFLQQKLRSQGLLNVLSSLRFYEKEITDNDYRRKKTLKAICEFLPKVEEILIHSPDTCLLQYALMAKGEVKNEALKQVKQFPRHVWFREKGNFHQRRQIAQLPNSPKIVHSLENDSCVIILENNDMILTDISIDSRHNQIIFENSKKDSNSNTQKNAEIFEVVLFDDKNFILTLDSRGQLFLWCIKDDRRRHSVLHSGSKKLKVNPLRFNQAAKETKRKNKQAIHDSPQVHGKIVAFHIEEVINSNEIYLHLAFDNGDVRLFNWNSFDENFQFYKTPTLPTNIINIRVIFKLLTKYYFIMSSSNKIAIWNLKDSSQMPLSFGWPEMKPSSKFICYELYKLQRKQCCIFVFSKEVRESILYKGENDYLLGDTEIIYEVKDSENSITCARLSSDGKYLLLGTKFGLIVIDKETNGEILRSNVSDAITCVDIHPLDDNVYKYCIVCGVKRKHFLYLFSILQTANNSIAWSHSASNLGSNDDESLDSFKDPQLDPGVWLLGKKRYDIVYGKSNYLLAVDSKNRIHKIFLDNSKSWHTIEPQMVGCDITAVTAFNDNAFIGYANGNIFNLKDEYFEESFTTDRITLLQLICEDILIASTDRSTCLTNLSNKFSKTVDVDTKYCYMIFEKKEKKKYLVLVSELGYVQIIDMRDNEFNILESYNSLNTNYDSPKVVGCDLKNSFLFMASEDSKFLLRHHYELAADKPKISYDRMKLMDHVRITCIKASNDARLLAVADDLNHVSIHIFSVNKNILKEIYKLESHKSPIYDMKFSPTNEVLVSCSEQLCFWSITYILNNPFKSSSSGRISSRFKSQSSKDDVEEPDAQVVDDSFHRSLHAADDNHYNVPMKNSSSSSPWSHKIGQGDKPELLACRKFDGNQAELIFANEDFTEFNTIDDEGVFYHLELEDFQDSSENDEIDNINANPVSNNDFSETEEYKKKSVDIIINEVSSKAPSSCGFRDYDPHSIDVVGNNANLS